MCNRDCCAVKTALDIRRMKLLIAQRRAEAANAKPKDIVLTPDSSMFSYEDIEQMASFIIRRTEKRPKFGFVCGSYLGMLVDIIENPVVIDLSEIPKFPPSEGKLYVGSVMGVPVIALQGRLHSYEGNPLGICSMPIRMMKLCGVEYVLLTCASGAVNKDYNVGDILLIKDHINFLGMLGNSPLIGPNDPSFGVRHLKMRNAYDGTLIEKALEIAREIGQEDRMRPGVYCCLGGPEYESSAEHRFLRKIGVDAVGMSLVHEVMFARHCGMKVFALSLISMPALDHPDLPENFNAVQINNGQRVCFELISRMIYKIANNL